MTEAIREKLQKYGYKMKVIPIGRLNDLKDNILNSHKQALIDINLYKWLESYYNFDVPVSNKEFTSIIIVASKSPAVKVLFYYKNKRYVFILPPTYLDFTSEPELIKKRLEEASNGSEFSFLIADNLPNKLIATGSGLGRYGRNNLCYVEDMGSFILLTALYSNLPPTDEEWAPFKKLPSCSICNKCVRNCPCGAIPPNRFTINADNCLTYHNEFWGNPEFPEWIPKIAHNSLVGCMKCQEVCPQNINLIEFHKQIEEFNESETGAILNKTGFNELPYETQIKLKAINLHIHYDYLYRNLKVLL